MKINILPKIFPSPFAGKYVVRYKMDFHSPQIEIIDDDVKLIKFIKKIKQYAEDGLTSVAFGIEYHNNDGTFQKVKLGGEADNEIL